MPSHSRRPLQKSRWDELALFGGEPAFCEPLHVGRPNLPDKEAFLRAVEEIWDSKILSNNGPFVMELEERFCDMTGAKHAVAVCNATLGLQLVARAMKLHGEIIVPSFTFIATPHAFTWEGLRPAFCDVDPVSHTIDPSRIEELITEDTCAIAGVHLWGNLCDAQALSELSQSIGLRLIFDAAHALGVARSDLNCDAEVYSLHATKIVSGFEGGVIVTNSDVLAHQLRSLRNFGFAGYDDVRSLGTNAKMSEVAAAMAICGLNQLDALVEGNRENFSSYQAALGEFDGIKIQSPFDPKSSNHQYLVVRVDESKTGLCRDSLMRALWAEGVRARRYFFPGCHRAEPYYWENRDSLGRLRVTEDLCTDVLVLPTGSSVSEADIEAIACLVRTCLDASRRIVELTSAQAA